LEEVLNRNTVLDDREACTNNFNLIWLIIFGKSLVIQIGKIIRYISNSRSVSRDFMFIFVLYVYLCYLFFVEIHCLFSLDDAVEPDGFWGTFAIWWLLEDFWTYLRWCRATWWCHLIILYYNISWTLVILLPNYMNLPETMDDAYLSLWTICGTYLSLFLDCYY
jgi:hypothetical protein